MLVGFFSLNSLVEQYEMDPFKNMIKETIQQNPFISFKNNLRLML